MTSATNEGLPQPPPPQPPTKPRLPFEYRNTELVSRLLAATPPYLYNMPLVPHSFFFSEMLRSLVQAKNENAARNAQHPPHQQQRRPRKRSWTQVHPDYYSHGSHNPQIKEAPKAEVQAQQHNWPSRPEKIVKASETSKQSVVDTYPSFGHQVPSPSSNEGVLPPPPTIWYPPLYPTPYGIDPLHFFIDLRVSGHIYDRKNQQKDAMATSPTHTITSPTETLDPFRYPRTHASAFNVPSARNTPVNLTKEKNCTKFDVKSLGLERTCNKLGSNYVLKNVFSIYKELQCCLYKREVEETREILDTTTTDTDIDKETEEEREKRVKDLRALIGLELVVDYMNHAKPGARSSEDSSSTDFESSNSPAVDVVAIQEEGEGFIT